MRIAFVTPEYVTENNFDGGLANYLHRVSLSLVKLGHQPVVIVGSVSAPPGKRETIYHDGIEVHRVGTENRWVNLINRWTDNKHFLTTRWIWQSWRLYQELKKIHADNPISIVQYASYTATALFRLKNIPSVVRISSYQPLIREAYGVQCTPDEGRAEKLEIRAFKNADSIFGPSHVIAEVVGRETDKSVEIIETPFVMDTRATNEQPYKDLLEGKKYLLFFGTVGRLKGVDIIADIINELLERHKDLSFVFVGKTEQNGTMMDLVWAKAGTNRGRVLYLGRMRHEYLYPILSNAFAVVLPSRTDNLPNTCLEAMAHKKVVIGTRGASFEQLLDDGKSGILCNIEDPGDLLDKIETVLSLTDHEIEAIGNKAFERVQTLKPEIAVNRLVSYYKEIITVWGSPNVI